MYKAVLDDVDHVAVKFLPSKNFTSHQLRAFLNEEVGAPKWHNLADKYRHGSNEGCQHVSRGQ